MTGLTRGGCGAGVRQRRGGAAVEFAVVVPVFFLFIFGLIELARGYMVVHELDNAARHGARTGVIKGRSTRDVTTAVSNYLTGVGIDGTTTTVLVNGAAADLSTAQDQDKITVEVSVPVGQISWLPGATYLTGGSLWGRCTLRHE